MKAKLSVVFGLMAIFLSCSVDAAGPGWTNWRGPNQNGSSTETGLPNSIDAKKPLWTADFPGQSTPVIYNGRVYIMGYQGEAPDLQEGIGSFDAETGQVLGGKLYSDFLSDTIYLRYATSSPAVDPETGNVYIQDTQGIFAGFNANIGKLWEHSMMEEYGRLTFPNGRTASPIIEGDLVITRGITANWGAQGPASDRFYAFDKNSGALVWSSTPGDRPKDNSFSHPVIAWLNGKRVFYAATGDGAVVCVNVRTGEPIFRVPLFKAGINSSLLLHNNDKIIAIYGTPYEPGQMVALKIPSVTQTNSTDPVVVPRKSVELWNNEIRTSTSSPILVGDRVYVTSEVGDLVAVNALDGKVLWKLKLGIEQRNASPIYADGKLYVPILNDPENGNKQPDQAATLEAAGDEAKGGHGGFYIVQPSDTEGKVLCHVTLEGRCYGTPTAYNGKIYIQTTKRLYCFGDKGDNKGLNTTPVAADKGTPGPASQLQIIPSEVLLHPGETQSFRVRQLDANGLTVKELDNPGALQWASFIPPTAKVKATMKATFDSSGKLTAAPDKVPSAGAFSVTDGAIKGFFRGRVLPGLPMKQDFESFNLTETTTNNIEEPTKFAYPPLPWIGARFKFEVREKDGNKCLTKTVDNSFFRRATVFMGSPNLNNYTIEADVMTDGNKRKKSDVGIINQRYLVCLKGNEQALEINSNQEMLKASTPFEWAANAWYHLKARVDIAADGTGKVMAKAWKKGDTEPEGWTLTVPVKHPHVNGCPGLFGFSPQDMRVYIDNIAVAAN